MSEGEKNDILQNYICDIVPYDDDFVVIVWLVGYVIYLHVHWLLNQSKIVLAATEIVSTETQQITESIIVISGEDRLSCSPKLIVLVHRSYYSTGLRFNGLLNRKELV